MKKKDLDIIKKIIERHRKKSKLLLLMAASSAILLFSGCQSENKNSNNTNTEFNQEIESKDVENDSTNVNVEEKSNNKDTATSEEKGDNEESSKFFSELSKYQFVFSSGAGAWQTLLNINADGSFKGYYSDSDMGDIGEGYPNGVNYSSTFEGKFTTPKKVNDYTYSISIDSINLEKKVGSEEIIDGIKYIYSEPYGLNDAKEILIYTTKAPLKELPEGFRSWVGYMELTNLKEEYLPFYGLYNVETESGFSSYLMDEVGKENTEFDITAEIAEIEEQYELMNSSLTKDDLTQLDMNFLARDMYALWDDEINKVWGYLKDRLDKDTMNSLTSKQKEWITKKENAIKEAGSEYEGGSIRPMIEHLKGAELTRDRVYELIELLK